MMIDATDSEPLSDSEFWAVIDVLEGRLWEKMLAKAARELATHGQDYCLRWAQTAGIHALRLSDVVRDAEVPPVWELPVIGTVIGKGAETYASVLANPGVFDHRWMTDSAQSVTFIGSQALKRGKFELIFVETAFSVRHRDIMDRAFPNRLK